MLDKSPATEGTSAALKGMDSAIPNDKMERMQRAVRTLIRGVGENPEREGLVDTPKRVAKALLDMTVGYRQCTESVLGSALFHVSRQQRSADAGMVLVRDIDFASTSEATLLPFHGRCHVAYIPGADVVLGLSKLARLTRLFAKRLQAPLSFAADIAEALQCHLACEGVAVVLQARQLEHVPQLPEERVYACVTGCFAENGGQWQELLDLLDLEFIPPAAMRTLPQHAAIAPAHATAAAAGRKAVGFNKACSPCSGALLSLNSCENSGVAAPTTPTTSESSAQNDMCGADVDEMCGAEDGEDDAVMSPLAPVSLPVPGACSSSGGPVSVKSMEAAMQQLLLDMGEDPHREALQGSASRYVESLLSSTSGYHQQLPVPCHGRVPAVGEMACANCGCSAEQQCQSRWPAAPWAPDAPSGRNSLPPRGFSCDNNAPPQRACSTQCSSNLLCSRHSGCLLRDPMQTSSVEAKRRHAAPVLSVELPFTSQCEHHMLPFYGTIRVAYQPGGKGGTLTGLELEAIVCMYTRRLQIQERLSHQVADAVMELTEAEGVLVVCDAAHMCMLARGVENHSGHTTTLASRGVYEQQPELRRAALLAGGARGRAGSRCFR